MTGQNSRSNDTRGAPLRNRLLTAGLIAMLLGLAGPASAQTIGMMANGRDRVVIFDADAGAVLNEFPLGAQDNAAGFGDCAITPDGALGFFSDPIDRRVWALDLTTSPPGANPEEIPLPGAIPTDLTMSHDGRFLITGSNFNLFLPITVIDTTTLSEVSRAGGTSIQSVAACDDGSIVGTSSRGGVYRYLLDEGGHISLANQAGIPPFFINSVCAPGSATAILVNNNTSLFGNGQNRSVALPGLSTIAALGSGRESNGSPLLNRAGDKFYVRRLGSVLGFNYDPLTGAFDPEPFFEVGGLPTVTSFGAGEAMALHPDGSRLYIPVGNRIDVYRTTDSTFVGSVEDPAIIGGGALCAQPKPAVPVLLVADAGGPYTVDEGSSILLDATNSLGAITSFEWDFDFDGTDFTVDAIGSTPTFDASTLDGPATRTVAVRISDATGNQDLATTTIQIVNIAPVADAGGPYVVDEGGTILLSGTATDVEADLESLIYEWDLDGDGEFDDAVGASPLLDATELNGPGTITVSLRVSDDDGGSSAGSGGGSESAEVEVNNVAPTVGEITGLPTDPEALTELFSVSAEFFDPGIDDEHTATWDWGDGTTSAGNVIANGDGSGLVTGEHQYAEPGVYVVSLSLDDGDGAVVEAAEEDFIVVYDPDAGFVTGGGWINSPPGAYAPDPTLTGSANFGLVAKYKKGAEVPTGSTEFQFQAGALNFHSNAYQWLVVAGARAQFKGEGTVNGGSGYGFMITVIDGALTGGGGLDRFRIKIWDLASGVRLYDNQMGAGDDANPTTTLAGGSIVIHKSNVSP